MKICVIFSSYEGSDSPFQAYDDYQDPSRYTNAHEFTCKFIQKESAREELDEICNGGDYDLYWSFLWGTPYDCVAGVEALKYLESKGLPIIGPPSKFLAMTKVDMKKLICAQGIKTPAWRVWTQSGVNTVVDVEGMKFPVIVKPSMGCGSLDMTRDSLCTNQDQLIQQLTLLQSKVSGDILIEEFIEGDEVSVMVIETRDGVISLPPLIYDFPPNWKSTEKFLYFDNKYLKAEEILIKVMGRDHPCFQRIRETGVKAYESLGVHGSGYARLDFRVTPQGQIYVIEVNQCPAFFSTPGNMYGDDSLIRTEFPGGHEALVETILGAKKRAHMIISRFDKMANKYDELFLELGADAGLGSPVNTLIQQFDFDGSVLDIGCGTGAVGCHIVKKHPGVTLTGIDVSSKMAELAGRFYSSIKIGMVENVLMDSELDSSFDHVISFGTFPFIDPRNFIKILSRMFCVGKRSVSLSIEDIPQEYNDILIKVDDAEMVSFNHTEGIEEFKVPRDWELVHKKREFMWESPNTGIKIYGLILRYEKMRGN